MSRLIQIDHAVKLQPEQEGYEFGYHAFEDMEPIEYETNVVDSISLQRPHTSAREGDKTSLGR